MNWKRIMWIIAGIILIAAFVIKLRSNKETATERVYHYDKEQAINVQVEVVELEEINANLSYTGTFEPNKESKISAETQGKINAVLVEEGSIVNKGQSLIQLDNSLLQLQLQAVDVQIEGLEADVKRYTILAQSDAIQGVQLEKTALGLKAATIQKAILLEQISKTTIRAPFSGIVTMQFTELGAFAAPGVPLLQLTDLSQLKFTINTSENELDHFQKGGSYPVYADIYPDQLLAGKVTLIGSKANMGGSYPIQITVKNIQGYKIKAGMFGSVNVQEEAGKKGMLIPSSAVVGTAGQPQVYVVRDGKAMLQDIVITSKIQDKSLVDKGVNEGDVIVVTGLINLFDGANVTSN
jgi:RND family efflux transporter MFP subunit